ncbi:acyltransferase [Sphingopyxis panaciterrae]
MKHKLALLCAIMIALLPSRLKIALFRARGARIGKGCYIGMSVVDVGRLVMGDHVRIGGLNLLHRLPDLVMESGSKIEAMNWVTGAGTGGLYLGRNSSIRRLHFFEASGTVRVGSNTIIAGRNSLFFTHGQSPTNINDVRPIEIGDWCYVGAAARFLPGAGVSDHSFVAMGAVVTKMHDDGYVVIGGSPGRVVKTLDPDVAYFQRDNLVHGHHPKIRENDSQIDVNRETGS